MSELSVLAQARNSLAELGVVAEELQTMCELAIYQRREYEMAYAREFVAILDVRGHTNDSRKATVSLMPEILALKLEAELAEVVAEAKRAAVRIATARADLLAALVTAAPDA